MLPPRGEAAALGDAHGDGVVFLFEQVSADDLVHIPQGGVALGRNDQPLGAAIQPVADAGLEAVFTVGVVLAFLREVLSERIHEVGVAGAVAVAEQVGGFIEDGNVLILIDDGHLGLAGLLFRCFRRGLCPFRRKKLVVDVQLNEVPGLEAIFGGTLFAVDLDALIAEAFIEQTGGKIAGHALYKAGQAHSLVIGSGGKLFHKTESFDSKIRVYPYAKASPARGAGAKRLRGRTEDRVLFFYNKLPDLRSQRENLGGTLVFWEKSGTIKRKNARKEPTHGRRKEDPRRAPPADAEEGRAAGLRQSGTP